MRTNKIYDENGEEFIRVFSSDIVEKVNPIEYYKTHELQKRATYLKDFLSAKNPFLTSLLDDDYFLKSAEEALIGFFEKFENTKVPENFLRLLEAERKKDQIRLLKKQSLNPDQLMSLIFKSYRDYGYLYSKYVFENLPDGFENMKLPKLFHLKDDDMIYKVGETDLSDGQLKHIIEHRKVIVSHFFEKDDLWHCFFNTYASLAGRENHKDGQAHFHYISSSFMISKQDFVESMRNGRYKSTSIHIDLLEYGYQSESNK